MFEKVQIKHNGMLRDFNLSDLDLSDPSDPTDEQLKVALSQALDAGNLDEYVVDRTGDTILNVRPSATLAGR